MPCGLVDFTDVSEVRTAASIIRATLMEAARTSELTREHGTVS
jgi:hypothetical protein